ncbi:hypothetical protein ALQ04_01311 [Pseudomonas cichorii]|uniref:Uncharacterized protein n=1 Tax=Pseudomonas cichorii TaxID=36746 RepID=A0A3M4M7N5_PSECI|nr:hypothetical protein [Pseudomonas cichorii]RMQ49805.1 hypothetical protein ALQ04_01311 [Pseudomonas cichorii]
MSYLNSLRLHFAGKFQANVSTVNNDAGHYDNAAFKSSYQQLEGPHMKPPNGWFNPQGDAAFRLLGCTINSAWTPAGAVNQSDPVLRYIIADANSRVPAKMVDLDPEQQLVSEIWGLEVRIADINGDTLLSGQFLPAAFIDIWDRATGSGSGDIGAGATYQSVLNNLQWGDVSGSTFLSQLKQTTETTGLLSIKFNVDGLNMTNTSPDFMCGRIAGTIGPYLADEPRHLVIGRHFMASASPQGNFFTPVGGINFFPAVIDTGASCIYLDLGNALSTTAPGAGLNDLGDLKLGAYEPLLTPTRPTGTIIPLGTVASQGIDGYSSNADWYAKTAGIVVLPLSAQQLQIARTNVLVLSGNKGIVINEWANAAFIRADKFVYRLSPDEKVDIPVYAMQYGQPLAGISVSFTLDPSQLQASPDPILVMKPPPVGKPENALQFAETAVTDVNGKAVLSLGTSDPGVPRSFKNSNSAIDGQVYGIRPAFTDAGMNAGPVNQWDFISFLLWSGYRIPAAPTWDDIQPIFQQYANLYPVMLRFLNMADFDSVVKTAGLLTLAFSLDIHDANSMPVTRDLSPAKRQAILAWLKNPLPGTRTEPEAAHLTRETTSSTPPEEAAPVNAARGGKAAAVARRLINQSPRG